MLIEFSNQWKRREGGIVSVCLCISPHFTGVLLKVPHSRHHAALITFNASPSGTEPKENIISKTFVKAYITPIGVSKFWWPGRERVCCVLVLTRLCMCLVAEMSRWTCCRYKQDCRNQGFDRNKSVCWRWLQAENEIPCHGGGGAGRWGKHTGSAREEEQEVTSGQNVTVYEDIQTKLQTSEACERSNCFGCMLLPQSHNPPRKRQPSVHEELQPFGNKLDENVPPGSRLCKSKRKIFGSETGCDNYIATFQCFCSILTCDSESQHAANDVSSLVLQHIHLILNWLNFFFLVGFFLTFVIYKKALISPRRLHFPWSFHSVVCLWCGEPYWNFERRLPLKQLNLMQRFPNCCIKQSDQAKHKVSSLYLNVS